MLDVAKGALPALAALHWSGPLTASIAGIVAMLGHGYPVLLGFGGGKGVATGAGAALALFPAGVGLAALAWAIASSHCATPRSRRWRPERPSWSPRSRSAAPGP